MINSKVESASATGSNDLQETRPNSHSETGRMAGHRSLKKVVKDAKEVREARRTEA